MAAMSNAEMPGSSPWDAFLERAPKEIPPRKDVTPKETLERQPSREETLRAWAEKSVSELATDLSDAEKRYHESKEAAFFSVGKHLNDSDVKAITDRLQKYAGANRPGFVNAVFDVLMRGLNESSLSPDNDRKARKALRQWKSGAGRLEKKYFDVQDASMPFGEFHEKLIAYSAELMKHLPNIALPQKDFTEALDLEFAQRYAPRSLLGLSSFFEAVQNGERFVKEGQEPVFSRRVVEAASGLPRRVYEMSHSAGLQSGLFLPAGLRGQDLNEVEKFYVKADYLATAATRNAAGGFYNLADEALHQYGLRPRRTRSAGPPASSSRLFSGDPNGEEEDDDDDDDVFYDVFEDEFPQEEDFFDTEEPPDPSEEAGNMFQFSEAEASSALHLLDAIHRAKRKRGGVQTEFNDSLSGYLMRDGTDLFGLVKVAADIGTDKKKEEFTAEHARGQFDSVRKHIDDMMLGVVYPGDDEAGTHHAYVRDISLLVAELSEAGYRADLDGVREKDRDSVRESIATYLSENALARAVLVEESIRGAFRIPREDDERPESTSPAPIFSSVRKRRSRSLSAPRTGPQDDPGFIESLVGYRGAELLGPVQMMANVVGYMGPIFAAGGVLYLLEGMTSSSVSVLMPAINAGASASVAHKATDTMLRQHIEWSRKADDTRKSLFELWDGMKSRFETLSEEKRGRIEGMQDRIAGLIGQLAGYINFSTSMVRNDLKNYIVAMKLRGAGFKFDSVMDYVTSKVEGRADKGFDPADVTAVNASAALEVDVCSTAGSALTVLEGAIDRVFEEQRAFVGFPEEGEDFLDRILLEQDTVAIYNLFHGCKEQDRTNLNAAFQGVIDDRLSRGPQLEDDLQTMYNLQINRQTDFEEAKRVAKEIHGRIIDDGGETKDRMKSVGVSTAQSEMTEKNERMESLSTSITTISADIEELREEQAIVLQELKATQDPEADNQIIKNLQSKLNELVRLMDESEERRSTMHYRNQLAFFEELQYVQNAGGDAMTRELYENMRNDAGLVGVVSDGRSPLSTFDVDSERDGPLVFAALNASTSETVEGLGNARLSTNSRIGVYGEDADTISDVILGVFNVLSSPEAATDNKEALVEKSKAVVMELATAQSMSRDLEQNAVTLAETLPEVYEFPINATETSTGKRIFFPKLRSIENLSDQQIKDFTINGTRISRLMLDMNESTSAVQSKSMLHPDSADLNESTLKAIHSVGFIKLIMTSAAELVNSLAVLGSSWFPTYARSLLAFTQDNIVAVPGNWIAQIEKDAQDTVEIEARIKNDYAQRIGLTKSLYRRKQRIRPSYLERVSATATAFRDSSWSELATELFIDIPEGAEAIGSVDSTNVLSQFFQKNAQLLATTFGISVLGLATWIYAPDQLRSSPVFDWGNILFKDQQTVLSFLSNHSGATFLTLSVGTLGGLASYFTNLPSLTSLVSTAANVGVQAWKAGIPSWLTWFARKGVGFIAGRMLNLDTLFMSTTMLLYFSVSATDALYFGSMIIFRAGTTRLLTWTLALLVDAASWWFVHRGSLQEVKVNFANLSEIFFNEAFEGNITVDANLIEDTFAIELIEKETRDDVGRLLVEANTVAVLTGSEDLRLGRTRQQNYVEKTFKLIENFRKRQEKKYYGYAFTKALLVGVASVSTLLLADTAFEWMNRETFNFASKLFQGGAAVLYNDTAGATAEAAVRHARLVTQMNDKITKVDLEAFDKLGAFSGSLNPFLSDLGESLKQTNS